MIELEQQKVKLPPPEVIHNRDLTKGKDVVIQNISLMIGGKVLLDSAEINL